MPTPRVPRESNSPEPCNPDGPGWAQVSFPCTDPAAPAKGKKVNDQIVLP